MENQILFSRETQEDSQDVWDDRALIRAYDRSIRKIKQELNKKFQTIENEDHPKDFDLDEEDDDDDEYEDENEFEQENEGYYDEDEEDDSIDEKDLKKKDPNDWKVDDFCMTVYTADGLLYPGNILKIFEDEQKRKKCIVKYLYYLNEEEKFIDEIYEFIPQDKTQNVESKKKDETKNVKPASSSQQMPLLSVPPPPLPFDMLKQNLPSLDEHDALHSMLLSWYMNGYHTGYYLGLTQANKK